MELIKELDKEKIYGKNRRIGLFKCPFCGAEVKRYYYNGMKDRSCGCMERIKHGQAHTRIYKIWSGMKERCSNESRRAFRWYGAKGIAVCSEWQQSFESFYQWAIDNGYTDNLTIDRIDPDKGYFPDNCRWVTAVENRARAKKKKALTRNEAIKAIEMLNNGISRKEIAAILKVGKHVIDGIAQGKTYKEELNGIPGYG